MEVRDDKEEQSFKIRILISLVFAIPILINSEWFYIISPIQLEHNLLQHYMVIISSSIIFWYCGWPFIGGMIEELKAIQIGMMTLVGIAIFVTYFYSLASDLGFIVNGTQYYAELIMMVLIMLVGHLVETKSTLGASRAIDKLKDLLPNKANLLKDGNIISVNINDLNIGDLILIKPGEKIPIDGIIIEGSSSINESLLTGEAIPVLKEPGSKVIGGSINNNGSITVRVTNILSSSYISSIVSLIKSANETKTRAQDFADKGARILTFVALFSGIITLIVWLFVMDEKLYFSLERSISIFVAACPHSLGLAIPIVIAIVSAYAARNGILIRNRKAFELLGSVDKIVFDKTGTITTGNFSVNEIVSLSDMTQDDILSIAASIEQHSEHLIGKAIIKHATTKGVEIKKDISNFEVISGFGIRANIENIPYKLVSAKYLDKFSIEIPDSFFAKNFTSGDTHSFLLSDNNTILGFLALGDTLREESSSVIENLKQQGITPILLTGDNLISAKNIADKIGVTEIYANVTPEEKLLHINNFQKDGKIIAMVGDGVNDAPALRKSDIGIAIGAGTEVAIESADIILVNSDLEKLLVTIKLAKAASSKMKQNMYFALAYNAIVIPMASGLFINFGIVLTPLLGTILNSLSDVVSIVNSNLIRRNIK